MQVPSSLIDSALVNLTRASASPALLFATSDATGFTQSPFAQPFLVWGDTRPEDFVGPVKAAWTQLFSVIEVSVVLVTAALLAHLGEHMATLHAHNRCLTSSGPYLQVVKAHVSV